MQYRVKQSGRINVGAGWSVGLAPPSMGCVRFFFAVLASLLLASEEARAQDIGPGSLESMSSISMGASRTVLGSTQWTPPSGSVAANVGGPGTLTFDPTAGSTPGPITVDTVNASAIVLTGSGQIAINPGGSSFSTTITTTGSNAYAIDVVSGQHNELLNNLVIITSGTNSDGIRIENPNNIINATNVTITTTGAGASALALISGGGSTANFVNSTLTSTAGPAIRVSGGSGKTISLTGTSVTAGSGDGRWLYVTGGASNTNTTASGSTLTGAVITDSGSTSNLTLTNGTVWDMTGSSNVTNLTNNLSTIEFAPPVGGTFKTLTTMNYAGVGGTIGLNTFLGADSSPSDLLIINGGTATGSTNLRISNAGGPGDYTIANGILVVEAVNGGTTAGNAFTLAGEARAGFFDYRLYRGGFNGTSPNDWFLRSTFNGGNGNGENGNGGNGNGGNGNGGNGNGENGNGGGNGGNGNAGEGPITPPDELPPNGLPEELPPVLPPGVYPIIGPEIATYGVVQPIARQMGLTTLGTLHERIGDTLTSANVAPASLASDTDPSVWGRVFGQQIKNRYEEFAQPRADGSLIGFQSGFDLFRGSIVPIDGHRDAAGLYFAYGNAAVDVNGLVTNAAATNYVLTRTGTVNFNAWTAGGYWTHYGPTDWYVDAVVQGTFYQGDATTQFARLPINGSGFASSLEGGYPVPLPLGPRFVLEPEAQIIWQRVSFDDANDGLGPVALGDTSGASGRIGLRGQWTIVAGQPQVYQKVPTKAPQLLWSQVWQPYVKADLWRDWGADATTAFAGELVPLISHATRLDLAAGLTARFSANVSLYGQAGYQFAVGDTAGGQRDGVKGDLGLRVTW